jgi:FkbM family methyltransferase
MANPFRFFKKCLTDRPSAVRSAKLVYRSFYGRWHWYRSPNTPLTYRLPTGGTLLLEPGHSFTGCLWPDVDRYEPDVRGFLQYLLKLGDSFIDCGANVGYFSILAAGLVGKQGKVISIEANPITYKLLERNLQANQFGTPVHCALTSEAGDIELFMPIEGDVFSSLRKGGLVKGSSARSFKVYGCTLDEVVKRYALSKVDVVKLDIEGAELDVLRSAPYLLSTLRPIIVLEYGTNTWPTFGATPQGLKELTKNYHYVVRKFDLQKQDLVPISADVWQMAYVNLILTPEPLGK